MYSTEEFIEELIKRRPELGKKANEQALKDIRDNAEKLTPETREAIIGAFINGYKITRVPGWAEIRDCAIKEGVKLYKKGGKYYYNVCQVCKTRYTFYSMGCPSCRKKTIIKIGTSTIKPNNFMDCREECYVCRHYGKYAIGVTCPEWGKGSVKESCQACICRKCCEERWLLKTDKNEYRRRMAAGELEDRKYVRGDKI